MEKRIINNSAHNRFELDLGDGLAFVVYKIQDNEITFLHTEVPPEHGGKGIAALLAKYVLQYAKTQNLKPIILCPYIKVFVKRHPEFGIE